MKKYLLITAIAAIFCSCDPNNPLTGLIIPNTTITDPDPSVTFIVDRVSPYTIYLSAGYSNIDGFEWDFGDGTYEHNVNDLYHTYSRLGTYTVTLRGYTSSSKNASFKKTITLTAPKYVYVSDIELISVPYDNRYYFVWMYDNFWVTNWEIKTKLSPKLSNSNMPYSFSINKKVITGLNSNTYYNVRLYQNSDGGSTGYIYDLAYEVYTADILKYYNSITVGDGKAKIKIYFDYSY